MNWARVMMRRLGNSRYRKEQSEVCRKLRLAFPYDEILMEFKVSDIAVLDIANTTKHIAYRLQGEYHKLAEDKAQAGKLKACGWRVIDLMIEDGKVYDIRKQ